MATTDVAAAELDRVLLVRIEGAIASGEQGVADQQQVVEASAGRDTIPSRDLLALMEWNLAALHAWRLELLDQLVRPELS